MRAAAAALFLLTAGGLTNVAAQQPQSPPTPPRIIPLPSSPGTGSPPPVAQAPSSSPPAAAPSTSTQSPAPSASAPRTTTTPGATQDDLFQHGRRFSQREKRREERQRERAERRLLGGPFGLGRLCDPRVGRMLERFLQVVDGTTRPRGDQLREFENLKRAAATAHESLRASCVAETTLTPTGQLEMVERRLKAVVGAIDVLKPALDTFYASLDDEQKARFNTLAIPNDFGEDYRRRRRWR